MGSMYSRRICLVEEKVATGRRGEDSSADDRDERERRLPEVSGAREPRALRGVGDRDAPGRDPPEGVGGQADGRRRVSAAAGADRPPGILPGDRPAAAARAVDVYLDAGSRRG